LLDSIAVQTFRDFEVIVSDDSDNDSVKKLLISYETKFKIRYFKNEPSLGTPANWNFGISKAEGEWIKIIHDDDWFATPESLKVFVKHTSYKHKFIFCAYANMDNKSAIGKKIYFPFFWKKRIIKDPLTLLAHNVVGPPSVILVHRSIKELYDERMKWRVDMDFYVRLLLKERSYTYIDKVLVNVGIGDTQVTNECFENPSVELPEGFLLLKKYGENRLKNIWVYDAWWRLLRNMKVTDEQQLKKYVNEKWPEVIIQMAKHLNTIPHKLLKMGVSSKATMLISYLINRKNL
jgi:glycosyltransferase involved in cell wall biosynthesis